MAREFAETPTHHRNFWSPMPATPFITDHMVTDKALQRAIVDKILAAHLPDQPDQLAVSLGRFTLPDGTDRPLFVRFAADAVLTDAATNVVLITRLHEPGAGRLAIPGGFIDLADGRPEDVVTTARRELFEETGIDQALIRDATVTGIGWRRYDRPFDLRTAWADIPDTDIKTGDIFMASTQPVFFRTQADLRQVKLAAGDDATAARVMNLADIGDHTLGIPDQAGMLREVPVHPTSQPNE
jgi:ADP-ribose pyrophosphatase YjhB (NUDIX family)